MEAMRKPRNGFLKLNRFPLRKAVILILKRQLAASTAHLLFIAVLTNVNLVKPIDPIFLNSTILMSALLFSRVNGGLISG